MKQVKTLGLAALATLFVSGCSLFSTEEITYKELQSFDAQINPRVVWDTSVGDGIDTFFSHLNPVVVGDSIIAADRRGVVEAFDRATGDELWRVDLRSVLDLEKSSWWSAGEPMRIAGGLSALNGVVYLGSENGDVVALNAADGSVKWHQVVRSEIMSDPAIGGGFVVVKGSTGEVIALNEETGEELWKHTSETPALSLRGTSSPVYEQGGIFVGTSTGKVIVLIAENGQPAWEARLAIPSGTTELQRLVDVDSRPVLAGRFVYNVAYNGALAAIEANTGEIAWRRDYSSYQNVLFAGGRLFVTDADDSVSALDAQGGVELWSNNDYTGRNVTAPVRFGDYIVVGDRFGYLHFINLLSGVTEGRLEVGEDVYTAPIVVDDTLYVQLRDGSLLAVRI
jgi:outer membrane protein assembly factor BamB